MASIACEGPAGLRDPSVEGSLRPCPLSLRRLRLRPPLPPPPPRRTTWKNEWRPYSGRGKSYSAGLYFTIHLHLSRLSCWLRTLDSLQNGHWTSSVGQEAKKKLQIWSISKSDSMFQTAKCFQSVKKFLYSKITLTQFHAILWSFLCLLFLIDLLIYPY